MSGVGYVSSSGSSSSSSGEFPRPRDDALERLWLASEKLHLWDAAQQNRNIGIRFNPSLTLHEQLKPVAGHTILAPFIFHYIEISVSVQAGWTNYCDLWLDHGVVHSASSVMIMLLGRSPLPDFPLEQTVSFEVQISLLNYYPDNGRGMDEAQIAEHIGPAFARYWKDDEVGAFVPTIAVESVLQDLVERDTAEENAQKARAQKRHEMIAPYICNTLFE